jgi:hypothetical protein
MAAYAGYQIISGMQQADAVKRQAAVQAQIDEQNAKLAEYDAWKVQGFGQTQMARYQSQIDQAQGAAKVSAAGAGVDISTGSLSETVQQNESIGLMNMLDIENQARERALGYTRQARSIRAGSNIQQSQANSQAESIRTASYVNAVGTVASSYNPSGKPTKSSSPSGKPTKSSSPSGYNVTNPGSQTLSSSSPNSYLSGSSQYDQLNYLSMP